MVETKGYRHLLSPEDRYDPDDDDPIIEPPTIELLSQFWQSARTGVAALQTFLRNPAAIATDRLLLSYSIDQRGQNFLHMAAPTGNAETIRLFSHMFPDRHGRRPQYIIDLQEKFPRQRDVDGKMPLHIAAANDNLQFVKAIIGHHALGYVDNSMDLSAAELPRTHYLCREDIRYRLPLLDFKNKAGRTAAQEAWHSDATRTAQRLDAFRQYLVGDDEDSYG